MNFGTSAFIGGVSAMAALVVATLVSQPLILAILPTMAGFAMIASWILATGVGTLASGIVWFLTILTMMLTGFEQ